MTKRDGKNSRNDSRGDFWVFGYGSLMWRPGFDHLERRTARIEDYRRAFRLHSIRYRGTEERPGLVVGLDWAPGAECVGVAFRVAADRAADVWAYLADRELPTRSYFEICRKVTLLCAGPPGDRGDDPREGPAKRPLPPGARVDAVCYVLDRTHPQYARALTLEEQAERIRTACGPMGPNIEYFEKTMAHLEAMGIEDSGLAELAAHVRADRGENSKASA